MIRIKITECFVLEGTLNVILCQAPGMDRDTFYQARLLRVLSSLALSTFMDGAATASLDLCQALTLLTVNNLFLISNLTLPSGSWKPLPLVLLRMLL